MDIACDHPSLDTKSVRIINYCQLYLHLTTISEMFDANGTTIPPHILKCEQPAWFDPTTNVTIQRRPSEYQIQTRWRPFCNEILVIHTIGPWILPLQLRRETYCHCEKADTRRFYHWYAGAYWSCSAPHQAQESVQLKLRQPTNWIPTSDSAVPIQSTARVQYTIYTSPSYGPRVEQHVNYASYPPTFQEHVTQLNPWARQLLSHIHWVTGVNQTAIIIASLQPDTPLLVVRLVRRDTTYELWCHYWHDNWATIGGTFRHWYWITFLSPR